MIIRGEKMEVYIELVYMINVIMILLSLEMMTILLNIELSFKKIGFYSLILSVSIFGLYIDKMTYVLFIIWGMLFCMIFKKQVFLFYPVFLIIYFSQVYFLCALQKEACVYNGLLLTPSAYSSLVLLCIAVFFTIIQIMYMMYCKRKLHINQYLCPLSLEYNHNVINLQGFLDTGNEVYYLGFPLILVKKEKIPRYQALDTITVDNIQDCMIEIIKVEHVYIQKQVLTDVYIGLIEHIQYDCLLNKQLMGGTL